MAPSAIDELMLPVSGTLNQPVSVPNMALLGETKTKIISRSVYIMYYFQVSDVFSVSMQCVTE